MAASSAVLEVIKGERAPIFGTMGENSNRVDGFAGKEVRFVMPFTVEGKRQSPLKLKVFMNDHEMLAGKDIKLDINEKTGKISGQLINAQHKNSGTITLLLANGQGQDQTDFKVNIMDKPCPPNNCLVRDVYFDSCVVFWEPPVDDGGTEVLKYIVEEQDVLSGTKWAPVAETGARELSAKITSLKNGGKYSFRVTAANKLGKSVPCECDTDVVIRDPWREPSQPGAPRITDWSQDRCWLSWSPPATDGGAPVSHYLIETRENHYGWQAGTPVTLEQLQQKDGAILGTVQGLNEGSEYVFRIRAANKRSTQELNYSSPSEPSSPVLVKIRYIRPAIQEPGLYDLEVGAGRAFSYDIWCSGEPSPAVFWEKDGAVIETSDRVGTEMFCKRSLYCEINTVLSVRKASRREDTGWYKIRLVSEAGSCEASAFVNVLDVPGKPRNFKQIEVRT